VSRASSSEVHQVRELDELLLHAVRDHLPAALVAGEVVQLLVAVLPLRHHEAGPLRDRPRLLYVRSLRAGEELPVQHRVGGDVVEDDARVQTLHPLRDLAHVLAGLLQRHFARVHLVLGVGGVLADVDGGQRHVVQGVAEGGEAAAGALLAAGVGQRPFVGVVKAVLQPLPQLRQVGGAHDLAEVSRRGYLLAGEDADAEGEAVVFAAELVHAVLGHRHLPLAHLDAHVGVAAVALALRVAGKEVGHGVPHLRERLDTHSLGHVYPSEAIDGTRGNPP